MTYLFHGKEGIKTRPRYFFDSLGEKLRQFARHISVQFVHSFSEGTYPLHSDSLYITDVTV